MNEPSVIITGANGFIGEVLVNYFHNKKWKVRALVHNMPSIRIDGVAYFNYSLEEAPAEDIFSSANFLIHCAYQSYDKNKQHEINITGTKRLIQFCRKYSIKPIFLSTFSAHSNAESHYGKIKFECEKLFDPFIDVVLKPGLVIGNKGLFAKMVNSIKKSTIFPLAGGDKPVQTIFIGDLCVIIEKSLNQNIVGIYTVAEPNEVPLKQFYKTLADCLHKKIFFFPVSISLLFYVCSVCEVVGIKLPVSSENILGLKQLKGFETGNDIRTFGLTLKTFRESIHLLLK